MVDSIFKSIHFHLDSPFVSPAYLEPKTIFDQNMVPCLIWLFWLMCNLTVIKCDGNGMLMMTMTAAIFMIMKMIIKYYNKVLTGIES